MLDFNDIKLKEHAGLITIILGVPALIISIVTLGYAYNIRKNEKETKEKAEGDKKNAFESHLREFFVRLLWSAEIDPQIIEQHDYMELVVDDLQPYFRNLVTAFNNYDLTEYIIGGLLTNIEVKFNDLKEIKNMKYKNYTKHIKIMQDILEGIAKKYGFDPLQV